MRLTSKEAHSPSFSELILAVVKPLVMLGSLLFFGIPPAIFEILTSFNPFKILDPLAWRDSIWGHASPRVLKQSDTMMFEAKKEVLKLAYGRVLEVGAGSGETLKYYDEEKVRYPYFTSECGIGQSKKLMTPCCTIQITKLFAVEPFPALVKHLRKTIAARGPSFEKKTVVVAAGIEDKTTLKEKYGVVRESIDSLVLVQCLCSMPEPKRHLKYCVDLLKPGGSLILIEHVASTHPTTRLVQDALNPLWSFLANGCELNRETLHWLEGLGCWEEIEVKRPEIQTTAEVIPHVFVRAIKKR